MRKPIGSCNVRADYPVIGISGNERAGKSTLAIYLRDTYGYTIVSPSDVLKQFVGSLYGFTEHQLYGTSEARNEAHPVHRTADGDPLSARYALDRIAVAVRDCCPTILAERSMRGPAGARLCNESVRFASEIDAVRAVGGKLIRRRGGVVSDRPTERAMLAIPDSAFDAVLPEFASKEQLFRHVDVLMDGWKSEAGQ